MLDEATSGSGLVLTIKLSLLPDHALPEMPCLHSSKSWMIVSGHGEVVLNGSVAAARTGEIFTMVRGDRHGIRAFTAMKLIEIRTLEEENDDDDRIYDS